MSGESQLNATPLEDEKQRNLTLKRFGWQVAVYSLWFIGVPVMLLELFFFTYLSFEDRTVPRFWEKSDKGALISLGVKSHFAQTWKGSEYRIGIRTNNMGWRDDTDYHGAPIDIGVYGDSFTFGYGVEVDERYTNQLRKVFPEHTVVSFSYQNGWAPPHYYIFLKNNPKLVPKVAILGLFLGNDLFSDIRETAFELDQSGELQAVRSITREASWRGFLTKIDLDLITRSLKKTWTGEFLLRKGIPQRFGFAPRISGSANVLPPIELEKGILVPEALTALHYVKKMQQRLATAGSRLVVVLIPWSFYVGDYPAYLDAATAQDIRQHQFLPQAVLTWCEQQNIDCLNPIPELQRHEAAGERTYFTQNGHWNANGHRIVSEVIAAHLRQGGLTSTSAR